MQDELTAAAKAGLVLSLLKGDLTIQEVCDLHSLEPAEVQEWIALALDGRDQFEVLEQLRDFNRRTTMFVFAGGALACIRLRERSEPLGCKNNFWCLPFPLPYPASGELIINISRDDFRIAEIDIVGAHMSLPFRFHDPEKNNVFSLEAKVHCRRGRRQMFSSVFLKFENLRRNPHREVSIESITLPPPFIGRVVIFIGAFDSEIKGLNITDATECLPRSFFNVVNSHKNNQLDWFC